MSAEMRITQFNEIIDAVEKVWGKKVERNYVDMRRGEHHVEITLDPTLLKELLDYELQWNLSDGLKETIDYYEKAYAERYKEQNAVSL